MTFVRSGRVATFKDGSKGRRTCAGCGKCACGQCWKLGKCPRCGFEQRIHEIRSGLTLAEKPEGDPWKRVGDFNLLWAAWGITLKEMLS